MKPFALTDISIKEQIESTQSAHQSKGLFTVKNLNLYYGNQKALSAVNMCVEANGIFALIGPSGCGKTSLLHVMARLLDDIPGARVEGSVYLRGQELYDSDVDLNQLRQQIGFVFQKPTPFPFSIYRNIELVLREHGIRNKDEIDQTIENVFTRVGLWKEVKDRLHKSALTLSGGQQQRLCMARALVLQPSVLLMDEPCSALDPISSGVIEDLIVDLGQSHSVVLVTHNLAQAKRTANDVAFFWTEEGAGVLVESGSAEQVFNQPQRSLTAAYVTGIKG